MARMPVSRLREWRAAMQLDPFPEERLELMIGQLTVFVVNALRKPDAPPFTLEDVVPDYTATPEDRARRKAQRVRQQMKMAKVIQFLRGE